MRYSSEAAELIINVQGGARVSRVLEGLGYKQEGLYVAKKTANRPAIVVPPGTLKEVKNGTKKVVGGDKVVGVGLIDSVKVGTGASRNDLMLKVKAMGIKNFRVFNKEELTAVVNGATKAQIEAIQLAAVTRWKDGWNKNKKT